MNKIVRHANNNGGSCQLLGPLVDETKLQFAYRRRWSGARYIPKRLVHLEPCQTCPDRTIKEDLK